MEKAKRQKVQANSQSIMIIWAKIQQNNVPFHLTGTATFRASAVPRLRFKGRSVEFETSSRWRELGNERLFLNKRRWPSSISIKKFFQLTETVFFLLVFEHGDYVLCSIYVSIWEDKLATMIIGFVAKETTELRSEVDSAAEL